MLKYPQDHEVMYFSFVGAVISLVRGIPATVSIWALYDVTHSRGTRGKQVRLHRMAVVRSPYLVRGFVCFSLIICVVMIIIGINVSCDSLLESGIA